MAQLTLYINTSNNTLVAGQLSTQAIDPSSLPFFYGDTLTLFVYLLQWPKGYNPQDVTNSTLQTVSTAGLTLSLYIDDGTIGGIIYTQALTFQTDPNNQYFYTPVGSLLALNTAALATLLGTSTGPKPAYLKIGYTQNGLVTTILSRQVNIGVGLPSQPLVVPPGQTPLSAEVANATYFPRQPVAGLPLFLESPNGKILLLAATDQPDGTAQFTASPIN